MLKKVMRDGGANHVGVGKFRHLRRLSGPIYMDDGFFRSVYVDDGIFRHPHVVYGELIDVSVLSKFENFGGE
jgi:hypothetical protein